MATTLSASMERSTTMAGHSRVNSSTMLSSFRVRPSTVVSNWKSSAHRAFGSDGAHGPDRGADPPEGLLALAIGHLQSFLTPQALDPLVVDRPALGCGPWWRLAAIPTGVARPRRRAATPAGPPRPRCGTGGSSRSVERCWPTTRHARRWETPNRSRSTFTAARRRFGVRSFPQPTP